MKKPVWQTNGIYGRNNHTTFCKKCKDMSYELLIGGCKTDVCCRCGKYY